MFKRKSKDETNYQELIAAARTHLFTLDPDSDDYDTVLKQIERLEKLSSSTKEGRSISPDAMLAAGVTIGSILIIVSYEHLHPIVSKAIGFVPKIK